jgi:hypothetical protein
MMFRRSLYLMTSSLAVVGLAGAPLQAYAQEPSQAPGQDTAQPYDQSPSQDPPARVGRLAIMQGTVSTHASGETQWSPAVLNAPVTDGDSYWTEPQAQAEIEVGASSLWMAESTEFDLTTLNDTALHAAEPQGEVYLHLQSLQPGETYTLETPRGTVTLATGGDYEIGAGDTQNPTTVTVVQGAAQITGNNISLQVHENQTASVTGDGSFQGTVGPMTQDSFLTSMLQREQQAQTPQGAPPVVAQMTGCQDLNHYGSWEDTPDYGQVWYPQVGSDWAPYRDGRWSYVAPWGWTWVDAAPWGFAPFHYGRWVQVGPRWGWSPVYPGYAYGGGYRPVYAPALVSFFGAGVGIGVGVGIGFGVGFGLGLGAAYGYGGHIGWVPLGPREAYFPPYGASRAYLGRVNVTNIRNVTNIYNEAGARRDMPIGHYANARAAVVMPARAMADSRPVAGNFSRPNAADLANAHGLVGRAPIAPGAHTIGLTPHVAQQLHVANLATPHAAGPRVSAPEAGGRAGPPALRPSAGPAPAREPARAGETPRAAEAPRGGAPGPAIGHEQRPGGLPALRQPGERPAGAPETRQPGRSTTPTRNEPTRNEPTRNEPTRNEPTRGVPSRSTPNRSTPSHYAPAHTTPGPARSEPAHAAPVQHHAAPPPAAQHHAAPAPVHHESAPRPAPAPHAPPHAAPHHDDPRKH